MDIYRYLALILVFLFIGCTKTTDQDQVFQANNPVEVSSTSKAKNIILMIGDGMGLSQITAAMQARQEALQLERFNVIGLAKTSSAMESITDSAASATAMSTGVKTRNEAIGVDESGNSHETILERLGKQGYATGLIATSSITHATPASFYAHEQKRGNYYHIAAQMKDAPLHLFIGGGRDHFVDRTDESIDQIDQRNILTEMSEAGFTFVDSLKEIEKSAGPVGYFIADKHPKAVLKGRGDVLPESIPIAISHLQSRSERGFFLMAEGAQIDWGGHDNNATYMISELYDFDAAVGHALDFAVADKNTLLVVTADHETGGLSLAAKPVEEGETPSYEVHTHIFSTEGHTSNMVPVFAFGPGAELFSGIYHNTEIHSKMLQALSQE